MNKKRIAILFGGKSTEHEVSCLSARNVVAAMDKAKYEPVLIGIDIEGKWLAPDRSEAFLLQTKDSHVPSVGAGLSLVFIPGSHGTYLDPSSGETGHVDAVFPVLHGSFGEDGSVQGYLNLFGVPYVGADVLGSAVGMDKDVMKRLLRDADIPVAEFLVFHEQEKGKIVYEEVAEKLGQPFFLKPANAGSSVGVHKVHHHEEFVSVLDDAFRYDDKVIAERNIVGREIECAVLGNETPKVSAPGEIVTSHVFYSYEAKYLDEHGAALHVPATLESNVIEQVQQVALRAYQVLCCAGMARVDCFLTEAGEVIVNEINTLPGFTSISMYPKLWEQGGVSYAELIDRLIAYAFARDLEKQKRTTSFSA